MTDAVPLPTLIGDVLLNLSGAVLSYVLCYDLLEINYQSRNVNAISRVSMRLHKRATWLKPWLTTSQRGHQP